MDAIVIGIDAAKDRLDAAVRRNGRADGAPFTVGRDDVGLEALVVGLRPLGAKAIAVEATGGCEAVVAMAFAAADPPVVVVDPAQMLSLRQGARQAGQDGCDRRRRHRPFCRSGQIRDPRLAG